MTRREIPVASLMDVDGDEAGTPASAIAECETCGVLYRAGGRHRCENGEWV